MIINPNDKMTCIDAGATIPNYYYDLNTKTYLPCIQGCIDCKDGKVCNGCNTKLYTLS